MHLPKKITSATNIALLIFSTMLTCGCGDTVAPSTQAVAETAEQEFQKTLKKAEDGDLEAQLKVASAYLEGLEGVSVDAAKGANWYQKAALQGSPKAQNNLGDLYQKGEGVTEDHARAVELYAKAAEAGLAEAQSNLARMYAKGLGVKKDENLAMEWWSKAAAQNHVGAMRNIGVMYYNGYGVKVDFEKAVHWFRKAADQGHAASQFALGWAYAQGKGVPQDNGKAIEWYQKAAGQGQEDAQYYLGLAYQNGTGIVVDDAQAIEWFKKSAAQGFEDAQAALGTAYFTGRGISKDDVLAYAWFNLAASKGNVAAATGRDFLKRTLQSSALTEAQSISSGWKKGVLLARNSPQSSGMQPTAASNLKKVGTGTLFVINTDGYAITNHHVAKECSELRVEGWDGNIKVVTEDSVNDLALLKLPRKAKYAASIAPSVDKIRQGEEVVVFGFPLSEVLSSGGNLTPGLISALTGLGNNTSQLQITAPIQPGSSGSPVINKKGEVIGVVAMKLSDSKLAHATGQVGQNVNFAINGLTLSTFLKTHNISFSEGSFISWPKNSADLADMARTWTFPVECWR